MKKSLVLAMAMALGVTASAYAANPFTDVPAGSWAYDSVAKLAAAGVVDGYPDGTFRGNRLMTRYEMAQIVAKAMAKGANVDRLAAEFADELDAMGVRVANLEAKQDNVKITGQVRASYEDDEYANDKKSYSTALRTRLTVKGDINENWGYTGMLQNVQNLKNNAADEGVDFQRAYLDGRLGGFAVRMGRANNTVAEGNLYDNRMDMVKASYGDAVKVEGYYAKPTNYKVKTGVDAKGNDIKEVAFDEAWGAKISGDISKLSLAAGYDKFADSKVGEEDDAVWNVAAHYNFGDVKVGAMYLDSDVEAANLDTDGYVASVDYKGAKASEKGSWGLAAKYYDQGVGTFLSHTMSGDAGHFAAEGFKGYMAGVSYTAAKNIVGTVEYYDLEGKEDSKNTAKTIWSEVVFTF